MPTPKRPNSPLADPRQGVLPGLPLPEPRRAQDDQIDIEDAISRRREDPAR